MGSACCVAARDHPLPYRTGGENLHRNANAICSPSLNFRRNSQGRVFGENESSCHSTSHGHGVSRNVSMELKGSLGSERGNFSDGGSTLENSETPICQKSPVHESLVTNPMTPYSDSSMASNCSVVVKNLAESPEIADSSATNLSFSIPSVFSTPTADHLHNHNYYHLPSSTPSRWAHRSPGHPLLRQISDSRILGLKSPNNSISEGRPSFVLSTCSNDITTGSQGESSDGWSMRTFSELVASSQRERWSFDNEFLGSGRRKISGSSSRFSCSPSMDLQSCGACSKLLAERSAWSSQKFIAGSDLSVVAVLECGHVYHAECLETMTLEADRYDPACPICMVGEKQLSKLSSKALLAESELKAKSHKISKNRVVDSYLGVFDHQNDIKREGKAPKMEPSSSSRSSFGKPFLRRHFSLGSKRSQSLSVNGSARTRSFWTRYRKD
ncbi:RING/U-box superfamily protein [Quillaja saponaria]|uniref:RING/U-box superfamily protein n=1 Tax=Quillaja saponaria TaxID=32244 RepID=A0AAD7PTZ8_QUISA|nr:RING/U-box superfamily protein [Quillaja saponaria]